MKKFFVVFVMVLISQANVLASFPALHKNVMKLLAARSDESVGNQRSDAELKKGIAKFYDEVP